MTRDPIGYRAGVNLVEYVWDSPTNRCDPIGLQAWPGHGWTDTPGNRLAKALMWHWFFGGGATFTSGSEGLKSQERIRQAARNVLVELQIGLCREGKDQRGRTSVAVKPQPNEWLLIQTTNVPSHGMRLFIEYSVDVTKCSCCRVDFDVTYRWLDLADIHPDEHWPDSWMAWIPASGEFWIDIRWTSAATRIVPLSPNGCRVEETGWPLRGQ